jgi:ABC-type transport system substrate-binding protein
VDPALDAPRLKTYIKGLNEVIALDERRVRFPFSQPCFLSLEIAGSLVEIIPKHISFTGEINKHREGRATAMTGPYRFSHWKTGREIVLDQRFQNVKVYPLGLNPAQWRIQEKRQVYH